MKAPLPALLLLALAACGRREEEYVKQCLERNVKAAVVHEEQGRWDDAIARYQACLALVGTDDRWKTLAVEWRGLIGQLETHKVKGAELDARFSRWKAIVRRGDVTDREWILREGSDLLSESEPWSLPWRPEVSEAIQQWLTPVDKR